MQNVKTFARLFTVVLLVAAALAGAAPSNAGASCLPSSLKAKLSQIKERFGPVRIVSTGRPGARIAGSGRASYHASCRAVDFYAPKGRYKQVLAWLRKNHSGGLGTYSCGMNHIHIDNGPRVRFHKCQGGGRFVAGVMKRKSARYASRPAKTKRYAQAQASSRRASSNRRASPAPRYAQRWVPNPAFF